MTNLVLDVDALLADGAELAALRHEHHDERYGTAGEESETCRNILKVKYRMKIYHAVLCLGLCNI